uniref:A disintegrin and metalloproteinase with thrombospondin motifs 7-like n=1 Tax=Myxine glutinosa TaxID=7769 RepID=UPI00358EB0BC
MGHLLSLNLQHVADKRSSRQLRRRDADPLHSEKLHYNLTLGSGHLALHLVEHRALRAPSYVLERRRGSLLRSVLSPGTFKHCHFTGRAELQGQAEGHGTAAISACDGLQGVIRLPQGDYFIEPVHGYTPQPGEPHAHVVYKRHVEGLPTVTHPPICGVRDSVRADRHAERRRQRWETRRRRPRRMVTRSVSRERWVETLVVADHRMVKHHGSDTIESYVFTIINMVAGLFRDASIGNAINIVLVRLVILEEEEENLKVVHHADHTLDSFCQWQKSLNPKGDSHPSHHDIAVLLTRKDLCAGMSRPCETLGLSHVSGMCQPHRSCNVNEDSGLPVAFTIAHELGHSFGIQHDGQGNECEAVGKRPFIMSPQLLYDSRPLTWSPCSRQYITRFLDRGWGFCLDDAPSASGLELPTVPPGVLYDAPHQCRLQYGPDSRFCRGMDNVCHTLWCSVGGTCHSKLDAAADGTGCGQGKWCFGGECTEMGERPGGVNGAWGSWSGWSKCTRTCGAGVQSAQRQCDSPTPAYGGKFCTGERKRYRVCNIQSCQRNQPSFRQQQCSKFDSVPYKAELHTWLAVSNPVRPCELHCRPADGYFTEKMLDAVVDGTPCYDSPGSRDLCIDGLCENVGCDYEIDSNVVEDRCGVCQGDGSSCETVKRTFNASEGLGYVDVDLIPEGARDIHVEEVAEAGNFLALRSEDPKRYFLNGDWIIQWDGEYTAAGTTFKYARTGNLENLTSTGPTNEPVWIQLLFQERNPGLRYEYTITREAENTNEITPPVFYWKYGTWTPCTATCGTGVQRQTVQCVENAAGVVEEKFCDSLLRPEDKQRTCNEQDCPARWWTGDWQSCSTSCGPGGLVKRTILCLRAIGADEQQALLDTDCQNLPKPEVEGPCPYFTECLEQWITGPWSTCSVSCGGGKRRRQVRCGHSADATCVPGDRPTVESTCGVPPCPTSSAVPEFGDLDNSLDGNSWENGGNWEVAEPASNSVNVETKTKRKLVDIFYYDYNFISFHEDSLYDLDGGWLPNMHDYIKISGGEDSKEQTFPNHVSASNPSTSSTIAPSTAQDGGEEPGAIENTSVIAPEIGSSANEDLQTHDFEQKQESPTEDNTLDIDNDAHQTNLNFHGEGYRPMHPDVSSKVSPGFSETSWMTSTANPDSSSLNQRASAPSHSSTSSPVISALDPSINIGNIPSVGPTLKERVPPQSTKPPSSVGTQRSIHAFSPQVPLIFGTASHNPVNLNNTTVWTNVDRRMQPSSSSSRSTSTTPSLTNSHKGLPPWVHATADEEIFYTDNPLRNSGTSNVPITKSHVVMPTPSRIPVRQEASRMNGDFVFQDGSQTTTTFYQTSNPLGSSTTNQLTHGLGHPGMETTAWPSQIMIAGEVQTTVGRRANRLWPSPINRPDRWHGLAGGFWKDDNKIDADNEWVKMQKPTRPSSLKSTFLWGMEGQDTNFGPQHLIPTPQVTTHTTVANEKIWTAFWKVGLWSKNSCFGPKIEVVIVVHVGDSGWYQPFDFSAH